MSDKSAQCYPKSSWDGWQNARRTLNSGERERKSVCFLVNHLAPVAAKQCSRSPPRRMCQLFSRPNLRLNAASSKYSDQPRATKRALRNNAFAIDQKCEATAPLRAARCCAALRGTLNVKCAARECFQSLDAIFLFSLNVFQTRTAT